MHQDTALFLQNIGVAPYLVERLGSMRPPVDNIYWEGCQHYIDPTVRYLSIPILLDLFLKADLTTVKVLFDTLPVLEAELEVSEREERGAHTFLSALQTVMSLPLIAAQYVRRPGLKERMRRYITTTPAHPSLRRGNFILPYFSLLNANDTSVLAMCRLASKVITCGCVLDDLRDYQNDKETGEPNIVVERESIHLSRAICDVTTIYRTAVSAIADYNPRIEPFLLAAFWKLSLRWRIVR